MPSRFKAIILGVSLVIVAFAVLGGLNVHAASGKGDGAYRQIGVYSEVLSRVRSEYVEEPNLALVTNGALHGLLEALDSDSSYLTPQEYKDYKSRKVEGKADIGATVSKPFGYAAVVSVIPGGPADKAEIHNGDILEAIEGKSTREMSLAEIRSQLLGEPGSNITFAVVRARRAEPQKVTVTRAVVSIPPVTGKLMEENIGYIKVVSLNKGASQEIASQVKTLQREGAKKLALDLRNVSSGEVSEAVATANLFLSHGTITYLTGQKYQRQDFNADPEKTITGVPLVVLVNRSTAGPAEIIAAAVLGNDRGDVLGEKTFGEGSVQKLIEIPDGSALILSIAKYYAPGGKAIQDDAITPNILVAEQPDFSSEDEDNAAPNNEEQENRAPRVDEPLQRAIQVLKNRPS